MVATISITDIGAGQPTRRTPSNLEAHGRGLHIVEALSDDWGTERVSNAKTVWFSVHL